MGSDQTDFWQKAAEDLESITDQGKIML